MWKSEKAFTLIEMLIVLTIITVLIILIIPNIANRSEKVHDTGCEALKQTVQAQVHAFQLEQNKKPLSLEELKGDYITDNQMKCKNGDTLTLDSEGNVAIEE